MKFRKKPVEFIEAEQWFPHKEVSGVQFCATASGVAGYVCETLVGPLRVSPGDWIITGETGEKYPCKDSIFKRTYEPVME